LTTVVDAFNKNFIGLNDKGDRYAVFKANNAKALYNVIAACSSIWKY